MCGLKVNTYAKGKQYEGIAANSRTDQNNTVTVLEISPAGRGHQGQCVCKGVANRVTEVAGTYKFLLPLAVEHSCTVTGSKGPVQSSEARPTHRAPTHRSAR